MKSRPYRTIAVLNVAIGGVLGCCVVVSAVTAVAGDEMTLLAGFALAAALVIAAGFVGAGVTHLKHPRRKSALTLAANSSVAIWIICAMLLKMAGAPGIIGPAYTLLALGTAYVCYRAILKPTALRAFPVE